MTQPGNCNFALSVLNWKNSFVSYARCCSSFVMSMLLVAQLVLNFSDYLEES